MASQGEDRHEVASVIRGHHVYKSVWTPMVGEELKLTSYEHLFLCCAIVHTYFECLAHGVVTSCHAHHNDPAFV